MPVAYTILHCTRIYLAKSKIKAEFSAFIVCSGRPDFLQQSSQPNQRVNTFAAHVGRACHHYAVSVEVF